MWLNLKKILEVLRSWEGAKDMDSVLLANLVEENYFQEARAPPLPGVVCEQDFGEM